MMKQFKDISLDIIVYIQGGIYQSSLVSELVIIDGQKTYNPFFTI